MQRFPVSEGVPQALLPETLGLEVRAAQVPQQSRPLAAKVVVSVDCASLVSIQRSWNFWAKDTFLTLLSLLLPTPSHH